MSKPFGGITFDEMVVMCRDAERRLCEHGDPFSGDDWAMVQIVRWALAMADENRGLRVDSDLYLRGYASIGACDIGNFLARCEAAGKVEDLEG